MNERIRELMDQAGIDVEAVENLGEMPTAMKFAELIVRECIDTAFHHGHPDLEFLLKHFGVEEQEKVAPKPKCSVCGTTENVKYMGGYQPYLCDSVDCIPF